MSKTVDDLVKVYIIAHFGADNGPRNRERYRAGIAAVVRALRDELQFDSGMACDKLNEILGDAGEKVAGSSAREDEVGVQPLPVRSPATDYSRKQCDNCDWPSLPECRKCGYPFAATPATDPAPAVCEFRGRPGRYIRSCNGARSIYDKPFPPEACAFCKKPVKFTEAK